MSSRRWSSYDEDTHRLPAGMTRVGYDADSQKYTFRDSDGHYYTSASGSAYGRLEKTGWDGGPLCGRSTRAGSASTASSGATPGRLSRVGSDTSSITLRSPTTFGEILSGLDEVAEEGERKPKEKSAPLPFLIMGPVLAFKSKLKSRRDRKE